MALSRGTTRLPRDQGPELEGLVERDAEVAAGVEDERRHVEPAGDLRDVHVGPRLDLVGRVLGRGGAADQLGERVPQLGGGVGDEGRGEEAPEGRVVAPPAQAGHLDLQEGLAPILVGPGPLVPAPGVGAHQDQVAHPLRVSVGVGHGHRAALRQAQQREAVEVEGIDDPLQIVDEGVEGPLLDVVVRQPAAALVVADQRPGSGQALEPVAPHGAVPVVVEVGDPVGRPHQRRSLADRGVGQSMPSSVVQNRISCSSDGALGQRRGAGSPASSVTSAMSW